MSGNKRRGPVFWVLIATLALTGTANADEEAAGDGAPDAPPADEPPLAPIESADGGAPLDLSVYGARPIIASSRATSSALRTVPGSGQELRLDKLVTFRRANNVQEVMRGVPGINLRDEVGQGVIPNIGVRGLNPDRSEKILILEDGVPAGFAPYATNAAYYIPPIERMERVELLKGSGQILYGPHTVGGVLNLITPDIPLRPTGHVRATVGTDGYMLGYARYGDTVGPFGYQIQVLGKGGDGYRNNNEFDVTDLTAKFRWYFTPRTNVTFKLNYYDQDTEATYLGLTQQMFDENPRRNLAEFDTLAVEWKSGQATLQHRFCRNLELLTNFYISDARRDWNRQDFARNNGFAAAPANTVITAGNPAIDGGAVYLRSSFGSRDRYFFKWGIEPRLIGTWRLWGREHEFHVGARYHYEKFINERNNRATPFSPVVTRNREVNSTNALAFFGQQKLEITDCLGISAGLRVESYSFDRDFEIASNAPVSFSGDSDNTELIPGFGVTYQLPRKNTFFAGVHRGFAPPRTTDAIDSMGTDLDLEAEKSWNYEAGFRGDPLPWLHYEVVGFYMDFENQVIPANESGGASTSNTNAGETEHIGLEASFRADLLHAMCGGCVKNRCAPSLWFEGSWTYVETENTTPGGIFEGNELPYAPNNLLTVGLAYEWPKRFSVGAWATYTDEQFTDQANTVPGSNDGTVGLIDSRWVVDCNARYRIPRTNLTASVGVNNLFDETYIASRAPSGIFAGAGRHAFLSLEVDF